MLHTAISLSLLAFAPIVSAAETKKYGIVFDAGSSGTRIHTYTWKTGGGGPKDAFDLVSDDLLKIKPGLSAFKDKPSEAGASLAPLIEFAKNKIPAEHIATTPMFLMATAGLRMVGEGPKDAILASVCSYLSTTGFVFKCEWAGVLDGRDEGLYGWVTVNYLLDALYPGGSEPSGIIDLGGGSVQIVYPAAAAPSAPAGLLQTLGFGGRSHSIYVKSHLGFGLDAARTAVSEALVSRAIAAEKPLRHPCVPTGATVTHKGQTLEGSGDYKRCKKLTKSIFGDDDKEEVCHRASPTPTPHPYTPHARPTTRRRPCSPTAGRMPCAASSAQHVPTLPSISLCTRRRANTSMASTCARLRASTSRSCRAPFTASRTSTTARAPSDCSTRRPRSLARSG